MTSLAYIFTMEKSPSQDYFWCLIFIFGPIFKMVAALLKTFGMTKGDMDLFVSTYFRIR